MLYVFYEMCLLFPSSKEINKEASLVIVEIELEITKSWQSVQLKHVNFLSLSVLQLSSKLTLMFL